jgi:hypothetical protein
MQWKSLARHPIRHLIELGTSNANTPAGSEETIGVGARVRLIHSDDPYTKLEPGDEGIVTSITPLPESLGGNKQLWIDWDSGSTLALIEDEDLYEDWRPYPPPVDSD